MYLYTYFHHHLLPLVCLSQTKWREDRRRRCWVLEFNFLNFALKWFRISREKVREMALSHPDMSLDELVNLAKRFVDSWSWPPPANPPAFREPGTPKTSEMPSDGSNSSKRWEIPSIFSQFFLQSSPLGFLRKFGRKEGKSLSIHTQSHY